MTRLPPLEAPTSPLDEGLRRRLPGLSAALDEDRAAEQVQLLLAHGTNVTRVSVGKVWLREDGTCTLRYDVRLAADADDGSHRPTVLGRVHPDDDAAVAYVVSRVLPVAMRSPQPATPLWRCRTLVVPGTGVALHPFPLDPELPTLGSALDPPSVLRSLPGGHVLDIEVVHHPREGACVLRYDATSTNTPSTSLYGKVYGDDATGRAVWNRLCALRDAGDAGPHAAQSDVRLPLPVSYDSGLRLLLTEALPGSPRVSGLLAPAGEGAGAALLDAVRDCGRALVWIHQRQGIAAPRRRPTQEIAALRRELHAVAGVWPEWADRVRRRLPLSLGELPESAEPVLSHGDFTPSQVLLGEGTRGVTDLDGVCWADPALDIGRFLACLAMLTAKRPGTDTGTLLHQLTAAFLDGYGDTPAIAALPGPHPARRVSLYRRVSLARSALHACRQLKDDRFARAVSLLESEHGAYA